MNQNDAYAVVIQTINAASQLPFVKVDREEFLRKQFKDSRYLDSILEHGPQKVFTPEALRKRAEKIIKDSTTKTSFTSFVAGLPSNPVTAAVAGGADVAQYMGFALNLAQQIAYLFGEDDLYEGNYKELPEEVQIRVISYLGIMFGASGASALIANVSKAAGMNLGKKVAQKALTKTAWYPLVKKVGTIIGVNITKKSVGSIITKTIPIIGGLASGGITYITFKPMGARLADTFEKILNGEFEVEFDIEDELKPEFKDRLNDSEIIDAEFSEIKE
ncbi:ABC transporter ATPase [Streptococcus sp. HMSC034B05]|uniref:ABC transporter ATPase n=1 Tax=Streptococcus sp. HMSC034B05 TaxID=1715022 RepID=UPI0008A5E298|nr:ABC transporter ATPase [Streptococcus sp. HMSC034B05]OFN54625.1 ABC transporter ATPase [Streptococcus sp. HMSC034B05]